MKNKFLIAFLVTLVLSFTIYSCTKEQPTSTPKNSTTHPSLKVILFKIIEFDVARPKTGCKRGFGLCNPHIANPAVDRAKSVSLQLLSPTQLELKFQSNVDDVREGELNFTIDENLQLSNDICLLLNVSSLELLSGAYPYDAVNNSVIITVQ